MKTVIRLFFALALALGLALSTYAAVGHVANLTNTGSSVIVVPGQGMQMLTIQNTGSGDVRLSFDGGAGYKDPNTGKTGTNPTPTTGFLLAAGTAITITTPPYVSTQSGQGLHKPVVAILVTSTTTTLEITTDDTLSSFPTT